MNEYLHFLALWYNGVHEYNYQKDSAMTLDLSVFQSALNSLKTSVKKYNENINDDIVRDSVIQRFEYTYSFALKMLKRFLEQTSEEVEEIDHFTFNQLIRTANEKGLLLGNLETWTKYRAKRNMTSHTYDEAKALEVVSIMDNFITEVEFLLNTLKERNAD